MLRARSRSNPGVASEGKITDEKSVRVIKSDCSPDMSGTRRPSDPDDPLWRGVRNSNPVQSICDRGMATVVLIGGSLSGQMAMSTRRSRGPEKSREGMTWWSKTTNRGEYCRPEGDALPAVGFPSRTVGSRFTRRRA